MDAIIGQTLETARQHFLSLHEGYYKFATGGDRKLAETWLNTAKEDPVDYSVRYAAASLGVDDPQILEQVSASMRFRVLAGILNRPVEYDTENILEGGICKNIEYDPEMGGWACKVPGNQAQADAWHERFGNSPACPFHEPKQKLNPMERSETEIEKMVFEEERDLDEALRHLGLRAHK